MKTPLKEIFDELFINQKVKNQLEFGDKLNYTSGYMTTALKADTISPKMQKKLHDVFGISKAFLTGETTKDNMFLEKVLKNKVGNESVGVEDLDDAVNDATTTKVVGDNKKKSNETLTTGTEFDTFESSHNNDQAMILEMMGLMKSQSATADKVADALEKVASALDKSNSANESMARSIEMLIARGSVEMGKRKAS